MKRYFLVCIVLMISFYNSAKQNDKMQMDTEMFSYLKQSEDEKAQKIAYEILNRSRKEKDSISVYVMNAYTVLGIVQKNKGFYVSSIEFNLKLLSIAEKLKDSTRISVALNNIGELYKFQNSLQTAIEYFNKSLKIEQALNDVEQRSIRLYNLGECYRKLDSFDIALSYFNNSLLLDKKINNQLGITYDILGLVDVYLEIGQINDAERFLNKITIDVLKKDVECDFLFNKLKLKLLIYQKNFEAAKKQLVFAQKKDFYKKRLVSKIEVLTLDIMMFEFLKDWQSVSEKYKLLLSLKEKHQSIEVQNKMNDLIFFSNLQKKELEINLIKDQKDKLEKVNSYTNRLSLFLLFVLLYVVGYVVYSIKKY